MAPREELISSAVSSWFPIRFRWLALTRGRTGYLYESHQAAGVGMAVLTLFSSSRSICIIIADREKGGLSPIQESDTRGSRPRLVTGRRRSICSGCRHGSGVIIAGLFLTTSGLQAITTSSRIWLSSIRPMATSARVSPARVFALTLKLMILKASKEGLA